VTSVEVSVERECREEGWKLPLMESSLYTLVRRSSCCQDFEM
jgi:hypothetical protein